ncbi:FHA domain-containing protein [Egicoccus sp. AB-alg6-2]|uniref:FHA domain-containing protein n=1 Tax=Egicoccus sp. AB-alg6-2 TaxID=3242692 RepID=UPI00359E1C38
MYCSQCGEQVPEDANFCPSCGAKVVTAPGGHEHTTAAIEVGAFDPSHELGDLPALEPGTGMLVVVRGPNAGARFLLDHDPVTVGRHPDSDIFLDDVTVSRRHAELGVGPEGALVRDLGSLNGSYVNGERVDERLLATGDEVQIGRFKLLFVGDGGDPDGSAP